MSLDNPKTLESYQKRSLNNLAVDLLVALNVGATNAYIKELARKIKVTSDQL